MISILFKGKNRCIDTKLHEEKIYTVFKYNSLDVLRSPPYRPGTHMHTHARSLFPSKCGKSKSTT